MAKYIPKKEIYFIVTELFSPEYVLSNTNGSLSNITKKISCTLAQNLILYYCEFNSDKLVKGQPITDLVNKSNLFEKNKGVYFISQYTTFIQADPFILKDCATEIALFEGKRFGFENSSIMTLPSNVKDKQVGFVSLEDSLKSPEADLQKIFEEIKTGKNINP